MTRPAIRVERLGKRYQIGRRETQADLRETLASAGRGLLRRLRSESVSESEASIWALRDVSFEVKQGEVIGIVGRNGAGKSTLLKILSKITEPTEGEAEIRGRVGSLLEVGTGFHPELTGRENIYLNGAILGMSNESIRRSFDQIVAFAEVEKFIDTPVKHYSSGMYMRLAFAVAAHLEPEVLLVDEVLAVGDVQFQKKCLGKIDSVAREGRTVLFVSHNMPSIKSLCQRAVLLDHGRITRMGSARDVVDLYLTRSNVGGAETVWEDPATGPGNHKARLRAVRVLRGGEHPDAQVDTSSPIVLEVEYHVLEPGPVLNVSASLYTPEDVHVLASPSLTDSAWCQRPHPIGVYRSRCTIPGGLLNAGRYTVSALLVENGQHIIAQVDRAVTLDVADSAELRGSFFGHWGGVVRPNLAWNTGRIG
jgi:lipopolysaccharide transport system ATP-binding protein